MNTINKIKLLVLLISTACALSCKKSSIEDEKDNVQKILLTKAANATSDWYLYVDADATDRADVWIDVNYNGKKDKGEEITKFGGGNLVNYPLGTSKTIAIYGRVTWFTCKENELTALDISKSTALTGLDCAYNQLAALDISSNTALTFLYCLDNQLTKLDVSNNTALAELHCSENELGTLNVLKNMDLKYLYCYKNKLTTLDVSKNAALQQLICHNNQLNTLAIPFKVGELMHIEVYQNKLTSNAIRSLLASLPNRNGRSQGNLYLRSNLTGDNESNANVNIYQDPAFTVPIALNWQAIAKNTAGIWLNM